jgi:hypothetical protein
MRRGFVLAGIGGATVAIVAACVGDDPAANAPSPDGGGASDGTTSTTPDTGGPTFDGSGGEDTGTLEDAGADAAKRHCETVTKPAAPTEFFCADFDGPDASEGWSTTLRADGGTFDLTNTVAVSLPQSLAVRPPVVASGNPGAPALQWMSAGAKNFLRGELRVRMNRTNAGGIATYTGFIKLLEIKTSNGLAGFYYMKGGTLQTSPNTPNYTGYLIRTQTTAGGAQLLDYPIATSPIDATWTDVKLTFSKVGRVTLTYNDDPIFDQTKYATTDTTVTFAVGAATSGAVNEQRTMRYDNVELTLERDP